MKKILPALLLFFVIGCANSVNTVTSYVNNASASKIEKSIIAAADDSGWTIRKIKPGLMEAKLDLRKHEVIVNIAYTADEYTISYKSSKNMNYNAETGTIHAKYNKWVAKLDKRIKYKLAEK